MLRNARDIINQSPMTRAQVGVIAVVMALNALDGFDLMSVNFASPGIAAEFAVEKGELGVTKSMGLVGMSIGSMALAPLADRYGRRPLILTCTTLMAISMLATALVGNLPLLLVGRLITGIGIGAMLASLPAIAAEYANDRRRDFCVSLITVGLPLGSVVGGIAAAALLETFSWRSVFIFGGVVSAAFVLVAARLLPESIDFLSRSRDPQALTRVNATLTRMGHPIAAALAPESQSGRRLAIADLFTGSLGRFVVLMAAAYFSQILTFYYFVSWVPDIVTDLGHHPSEGARVLSWANFGGVAGGVAMGFAAMRYGAKPSTIAAMIATAALVALFGLAANDLSSLVAIATATGFAANAGIVGIYVIMARGFPTDVRVFGIGVAIGIGRMGGILAPATAGFLFQFGFERAGVSMIMALGAVVAAFMIAACGVSSQQHKGMPS